MNKKQTAGMALILMGVASFAIFLFQANSYITFNSFASATKEQSLQTLQQLQNDPSKLAAYGVTAADLSTYGPQLTDQINQSAQTYYTQANSLVVPMAVDFVLALIFCLAGIKLRAEHS